MVKIADLITIILDFEFIESVYIIAIYYHLVWMWWGRKSLHITVLLRHRPHCARILLPRVDPHHSYASHT